VGEGVSGLDHVVDLFGRRMEEPATDLNWQSDEQG